MNIIIREIKQVDYLAILSLWNDELGSNLVTAENIASYHEGVRTDGRYKTFVALFEDKAVGFVTMVQSCAVGLEVGFIHITGIAVKKELQNMGIGTKLLKHIEDYAKTLGIHSIILNSGVKRTDAHAFYQRNGYDKDSWCFDKRC